MVTHTMLIGMLVIQTMQIKPQRMRCSMTTAHIRQSPKKNQTLQTNLLLRFEDRHQYLLRMQMQM